MEAISSRSKPSCFFINRCYWPDFQATGQLLTELCESLADRWDTTVLTGMPVFQNGDSDAANLAGRSIRNGVRIERLNHFQASPARIRWRIANLASFTLAARKWIRRSVFRPDVIVCETDPFFLPLIAAPEAKRAGSKLVFYLQDIYPDIAVALGMSRENFVVRQLRERLRKAYLQADRIIVLSDDMRDRLMSWDIPASRIEIVPNWVDCEKVYPVKENNTFRHRYDLEDRFVVMHSGNMGQTQRLDRLIDAIADESIPEDVSLALVGNGGQRPALQNHVVRMQLDGGLADQSKVQFYDYQPKSELADSLSAADLHVISMDERITGLMAPSKLYGILASGTPILAIVPPSCEIWRIVETEKIGWCVRPGDHKGLVDALVDAAQTTKSQRAAMSEKARELAVTYYDRQTCCRKFEAILQSLVETNRGTEGMRDFLRTDKRHERFELPKNEVVGK